MTTPVEEFSQASSASPISSELPMPDQVVTEGDGRHRPLSPRSPRATAGALTRVILFEGEWSGVPISSVEYVDEESARSAETRRAVRLLESWLEDESGYDEAAWPELKKRLDEDRPSSRPLFP